MFNQLIKKISENKKFVFTGISLFSVLIWYLNFSFLSQHIFLNIICFLVYFFLNSFWLGKILNRRGFEKEIKFILGLFCLLFLIGFGMAVAIVVYKITPAYLFIYLIVLSLIISFWAKSRKKEPVEISLKDKIIKEKKQIKDKKIIYVIWLVLFIFSFFLLFYARTGRFIRSPWEVIHPSYIYAWLGIIFVLAWLAFSKIKLKKFLILIILTSVLCHAYLLIPYQAGFGGDKWRHLGSEKLLMEGEIYPPTLIGEGAEFTQFGKLKIPKVLMVGNKTSYANMWGLSIALSWLTGIDIFVIDLILGFLLFSIFFPFLLLKLGLFFSKKREFLFLLLIVPFCFYPFQAYGSITVPVSFSFLIFLFGLIFLAKYLIQKKHSKKLFYGLIFLIPFLYFSYLLYLILYLEILVLVFLFKYFSNNKKVFLPLIIIFFTFLLIFIPVIETYNQYSWFKNDSSLGENLSKMTKELPLKLVSSQAIFPRVYGLEQDNWLYATVNRDLSRSVFFDLLPWVIILTPLVWLFVLIGLFFYQRLDHPKLGWLFLLFLIIVLINQGFSQYLLSGSNLLGKRLVFFTSFLFFFPLAWGIYCLIKKGEKYFSKKSLIFIFALFLTLLSTTVYASGPKFQVVTQDEYQSAKYLWGELKEQEGPFCVLANTWPLLALEGVSGREIITGGFPYYYEYRQPERVQLFDNMNKYPSIRDINKSLAITKAKSCYFITEKRWIHFDRQEQIINQLDYLLGEHKNIGEVMIWHYQPYE